MAEDGSRKVGNEAVGKVANDYFQKIFSSSQPFDFEEALDGIERRVSNDMNEILCANFTADEVFVALKQMHPLKAPGPDGMCPLFFQTYWHIVGPAVTSLVLSVLRSATISESLNKTFIVLIPKRKDPEHMTDFRPISLCNVVYKLISKVLANRLKVFLSQITSINQSAFTPGRLITDNILVAFEMFHFMKNSTSGVGSFALKLDMAKTYDRVEWSFLRAVMVKMGFVELWINRVMHCVSSVSFSVLINGIPSGEIIPERGLRQRDPLSPYLFILCAEVLSGLLSKAVAHGSLHGIKVASSAPTISHLLFTDDSIIFLKANAEEVLTIKNILKVYELTSGQMVNFDKTTVSFSKGVHEIKKREL